MNNTTSFTKMHNEMIKLRERAERAEGALAVPDWNVNIERIRDVMHMLGISIEESVECFSAALPTNINRMTLAMKRHLQELAGMTAITPTPFIPDDDTRRNDEAFAAQQEAIVPSVPDVLIQLRDKVTKIPRRTEYLSGQQFAYVRLCEVVGEIEALLQSSDHSSEVKK